MLEDSRDNVLAATFNLVGLLLVVVPLLNLVNLLPPNPSSADWRFGAFGVTANNLLLPVVGITLLAGAAKLTSKGQRLRWIATLAGLASFVLFLALGVFAFDALGQRNQVVAMANQGVVQGSGVLNFDANVAKAGVQGLAAIIACAAVSWVAWRGAGKLLDRSTARKTPDSSMLVATGRGGR